jgi:serine/threonine protein kinase
MAMALAGRFGPLEIVGLTLTDEQLGRGSDATVYRVVLNGASYAGKQLHNFHLDDQKCVDSFILECTKWSQLKHPNIVKFVGVYSKGDSPIPMLIMEKMDTSLWLHLQRHSKEQFTTESKTSVLCQVTEALVYLHSRSPPLIHCDVSPNNILLNCETLEAKLSDFGMTRTAAYAQATIKSSVKGTQAFIAPEAQKVSPQYDEKRDIFSFGNVIITMVTHKWPLPGPATDYNDKDEIVGFTEFQRRASHLAEFTPQDNDLFRSLVEKCLENRPTKRPNSEELMQYMKRIQGFIEDVREFVPYIDSMLPHLVLLGTVLSLKNFTDAVVNDPGRHDQKCRNILNEWLRVNPGSTWILFCEKLKGAEVFSNLRSTIQRDKLHGEVHEGKLTFLCYIALFVAVLFNWL